MTAPKPPPWACPPHDVHPTEWRLLRQACRLWWDEAFGAYHPESRAHSYLCWNDLHYVVSLRLITVAPTSHDFPPDLFWDVVASLRASAREMIQ